MAGPWEKYGAQPAAPESDAPWLKYAAPPAPPAGGDVARPKNKAEFDAMPNNTQYIAPSGEVWIKTPDGPRPAGQPDFGKPPPGVIIHGAGGDYVSDRPDISMPRLSNDGANRDQAVRQMGMLVSRGLSQELMPAYQGASMGWGDEAVSAAAGAADALRGRSYQDSYDVSQEAQRQAFEREREAHPKRALAGQIAGGALTALAGSPIAAAARGAPLVTRVAATGLDGLAQGAITGAGSAENGDRFGGAAQGAVWGGGLGLGAGAAAPLIGKGVQAVRNFMQSASDPALAGLSRPAREYAAGLVTNPQQATDLLRLGPNAMLADVSPEWFGIARGAAARPGSRDTVVNALVDRRAGANARLGTDLDASLGPRVIPSQIEGGLAAGREAVARDYGPLFANARAVDTSGLANNLDTLAVDLRGPAQQAVQRVRNMLDVVGTPGQLDPNPGTLFQTRQAIDGMMAGEQNPQVIRQLTIARQQVDAELARAVPGIKEVDARYAELARQSEGLQRGGQVLENGKSAIRPEELQQEITAAALPQGTMVGPSGVPARMQQGARGEIDRVVGTNANDPTAWRRLVRGEGDWNRDKLGTLFGQDAADRALAAGDREARFADTANRVANNSETAMTNQFAEKLNAMGKPTEIPAGTTWLGGALSVGKRALDELRNNAAAHNAQRFVDDLGALSVATGSTRDQIVQALMARAQARGQPIGQAGQLVIDALLGTRQGAAQELSRQR